MYGQLNFIAKHFVGVPKEQENPFLCSECERVRFLRVIITCMLKFEFPCSQNAGMRLYGGAQYHRAMAEFRFVVGGIKCPPITREEIVNACGVEDIHDGTNYSRYCLSIFMVVFLYFLTEQLLIFFFFLFSFGLPGRLVSQLLQRLVIHLNLSLIRFITYPLLIFHFTSLFSCQMFHAMWVSSVIIRLRLEVE